MFIQVGGHVLGSGARFTAPIQAEIDDEDYDKVKDYKWSKNNNSNPHTTYVKTHTGGKKIILHRLIMGLGDYKEDKRIINHKDGNGLNNKKENLEICDSLYNSQSFNKHNCPNGYVYIDNSNNRKKYWRACITIFKKTQRKTFYTKEEAENWIEEMVKSAKIDKAHLIK